MPDIVAPLSRESARHRARLAGLKRAVRNGERPPGDPELLDAQQEFAVARTADYINRVLAAAPPLTQAQRDKLAELLQPVRR